VQLAWIGGAGRGLAREPDCVEGAGEVQRPPSSPFDQGLAGKEQAAATDGIHRKDTRELKDGEKKSVKSTVVFGSVEGPSVLGA
jgi:hypothetical protein